MRFASICAMLAALVFLSAADAATLDTLRGSGGDAAKVKFTPLSSKGGILYAPSIR
jgi:hypothetical protein